MLQNVTLLEQVTTATAGDQGAGMTRDPQMLDILARIRTFAPSNAPVLLQAECGADKTLLARAIPRPWDSLIGTAGRATMRLRDSPASP